MMKRLLLPLVIAATLVSSACSQQQATGDSSPSLAQEYGGALLGKPNQNGSCDSSVIDIDHSQFTAVVKYHGNAEGKVTLTYIGNSGNVVGHSAFETGKGSTHFTMSTGVRNEDLKQINVTARSVAGQQEEKCFIPIA